MSELTLHNANVAYAKMMNTCDSSDSECLLAPDFHYACQTVISELESKESFVDDIQQKLQVIKDTGKRVNAVRLGASWGHLNVRGCRQVGLRRLPGLIISE